MDMCDGVVCADNATCFGTNVTVNGVPLPSYTCRCDEFYSGDGFLKCTLDLALDEKYLFVIVTVCLLFVGLLILVIFFLCKRRISDGLTMRQPLVGTMEVTAYDSKWESIAGKDKTDGPPPYEEKKAPEPDEMETFHAEVRVPVTADDIDETDDAKDFDNPSYDTVANAKLEEGEGIDNPTYDGDLTPSAVEVEVEAEPAVDDGPGMEGQLECAAEESAEAEEVTEAEVGEEVEKSIAVTFTEGELPNTVSAHVTTPDAALTINLNISLPDYVVPIEDGE